MANVVTIRVSAKDEASPAMSRIGQNAKTMGADVDRATSQVRTSFGSLRAPAAAVGLAIVGIGVVATKMASDLAEARNAVKETFGPEGVAVIDEFGRTSAESFGVSARAANEYAATLGAIFRAGADRGQAAALSRDAVKLAADLGSLRNLRIEDALEKIRAGLVGESEPLRTVGILLSENVTKQAAYRAGIAKTGEELTEGQKVMARWIEIVRQAGPAHGDFGRTLETSLPNQMKVAMASTEDLADALGEKLIPAARNSISAINDLIDTVAGLPAPAETATVGIAGTVAALIALGLAVSPIKLVARNLRELWAIARAGAVAVGIGGTAAAATAAAVAVGIAGTAFITYKGLAEAAAMAGNEFASTTKRAMAGGADAVRTTIADFEGLRVALQSDLEAFRASGKDVTALERQLDELDEMLGLLRDSANAIPSAMDAMGNGMAQAAKDAEELTKRVREGAKAIADMKSAAHAAALKELEAMFPQLAEEGAGRGEDFPPLTGIARVKQLQEDARRVREAQQEREQVEDPLGDAIKRIQERLNRDLAEAFVKGGETRMRDLAIEQSFLRAEIGKTAERLVELLGVKFPAAMELAADAILGIEKKVRRNELQGFLGQLAARRSMLGLQAIEGFSVRMPHSAQNITINRTIGQLVVNGGTQETIVAALERADQPTLDQLARTPATAR